MVPALGDADIERVRDVADEGTAQKAEKARTSGINNNKNTAVYSGIRRNSRIRDGLSGRTKQDNKESECFRN